MKNEQIKNLLIGAGVNVSDVRVVGRFIHVDTFQKYKAVVQHILTASGFSILMAHDGHHIDGFQGLRISGKLNPKLLFHK